MPPRIPQVRLGMAVSAKHVYMHEPAPWANENGSVAPFPARAGSPDPPSVEWLHCSMKEVQEARADVSRRWQWASQRKKEHDPSPSDRALYPVHRYHCSAWLALMT